jgi:hypothetical protein
MHRSVVIAGALGGIGLLLILASTIVGWVVVPNFIEKKIEEVTH